jgi:Photosynthesis system II assembly factor YCF48
MSDTKQNDSERALARLLAQALRPSGSAADDSACPDAELLAAYAEQNLETTEAAHWEEHFAGCARCQKILAVLTVSGEEPLSDREVEHFGRLAAAAGAVPGTTQREAPEKEREKVASFVRPRTTWRWLAPAVGIAAAAALWIALRPAPPRGAPAITAQKTIGQPSAPSSAASGDSLIARADVPAPPAAALRDVAPRQQLKSPAQSQLQKKETEGTTNVVQVPQQSAPQTGDAAAARRAQEGLQAPEALAQKAKASDEVSAARPVAAPPAPAPAAEPIDATAAQTPAPTAAGKTSENKAAQTKPSENRPLQAFALRGGAAGLAGRPPIVLAAPNRNVLWRLGPASQIERSTDQGQTWQQQSSSVTSDLLAGSAPSDKVAWIVGRAGVLLRTTDGEHWQRVASPDPAADWIAIEASDALRATMTSADRRRFATDDGGQTWKQQ